jgi:hypothetical protein
MYQPYPPQPVYYGSRYSGCLKLVLYAISFFIPLVGLVIGVIFLTRPDPESRSLGQTCLILGILSFLLACCLSVVVSLSPALLLPFMEGFATY